MVGYVLHKLITVKTTFIFVEMEVGHEENDKI